MYIQMNICNIWQSFSLVVTSTSAQHEKNTVRSSRKVGIDIWQQFHHPSEQLQLLQISFWMLHERASFAFCRDSLQKTCKPVLRLQLEVNVCFQLIMKPQHFVVDDLVAPNLSVWMRAGPREWGVEEGGLVPTRSLRQRCEGSACFLGKRAAAKSRCRGAPQGQRHESRLEEVQCESRQGWAWITVSCLLCRRMGD